MGKHGKRNRKKNRPSSRSSARQDSSPKRSRTSEKPEAEPIKCSACQVVSIDAPVPCFLMSCGNNCKICARCYSAAQTGRGCSPRFRCPSCKATTRGCTVHDHHPDPPEHQIKAPDDKVDPVRYHHDMNRDNPFIGLTMTVPDRNATTKSLTVYSAMLNTMHPQESDPEFLEPIFQMLHSFLVLKSEQQEAFTFNPVLHATEEALAELAQSDNSLLHRCIYALATGQSLGKAEAAKENSKWATRVKTTFALADGIRSLTNPYPGVTNKIIGAQLNARTADKTLVSFLSSFGLCQSNTTYLKELRKNLKEKVLQGLDFEQIGIRDYLLWYYDNIGFRIRGGKAGYEQHTVLICIRITEDELKELGIYPSEGREKGLSRERKVWDEVKGNVEYSDILEPSNEDYETLSESVLRDIDSFIQQEKSGAFPTIEECKTMLDKNRYQWSQELPLSDQGSAETEAQSNNTSPLDVNGAMMDVPLHMDLNSSETCDTMASYIIKVQDRVLEGWVPESDDEQDDPDNSRPIMLDVGSSVNGDGQPTLLFANLRRQNPEKYSQLRFDFGGFHTLLAAFKANGKLFGRAHLKDSFSCWRTSEKQLQWVMDPSDPSQMQEELITFYMALHVSAIRGLKERKARFSPQDLVDFMLERAKKYPLVAIVLSELRLASIIFLLLDAESNGDAQKFKTALKFQAPYCCSSHKVGYVSLISDFFVGDYCSSEAERVLRDTLVLFRKTVNGKDIFGDRFVEWTIKDIRRFLGKHSSGVNHAAAVMRMILKLNEYKTLRRGSAKGKGAAPSDDELRFNRVFCETLVYAEEMNLFGLGDVKTVPAKGYVARQSAPTQPEESATPATTSAQPVSPSGQLVNPDSCFPYSMGVDRWRRYFKKFLKEGDWSNTKRPEAGKGGVSLKAIDPETDVLMSDFQKQRRRLTLLDADEIEAAYTSKDIQKELKDSNTELSKLGLETIQAVGKKKKHVAPAIAKARDDLKKVNSKWLEKRVEKLTKQHEAAEKERTEEFFGRLSREMGQRFFTLEATPVAHGKYNKSYKLRDDEDDVDDGDEGENDVPDMPPPPGLARARSSVGLSQQSASSRSTANWGTGHVADSQSTW